MKILLSIIIFLFLSMQVFADVFEHPLKDTELLNNTIYSPMMLKGNFNQTRQISSMNITLKSNGEFALDKKEGILWRTLKPIASDTIIKNKRICTVNASGTKSIDLSENEAATEILTVINSIFTQEYEKAAAWFDFYFEHTGSSYTLGLVTKDKGMAQVIKRMTVQGAKYAEVIVIEAQNGDVTTIIFTDISEESTAIDCP